jgi:hypothetical protein
VKVCDIIELYIPNFNFLFMVSTRCIIHSAAAAAAALLGILLNWMVVVCIDVF